MHKIQEFFKDIIHATTMMVENNKEKKDKINSYSAKFAVNFNFNFY